MIAITMSATLADRGDQDGRTRIGFGNVNIAAAIAITKRKTATNRHASALEQCDVAP